MDKRAFGVRELKVDESQKSIGLFLSERYSSFFLHVGKGNTNSRSKKL